MAHRNSKTWIDRKGEGSVRGLAAVRWLVVLAITVASLAVVTLVFTAFSVARTIDLRWQEAERLRAVAVGDWLSTLGPEDTIRDLGEVSRLAGLPDLAVVPAPLTAGTGQAVPLFEGPYRGQMLAWNSQPPGLQVLHRFAPVRIAFALGVLIILAAILTFLLRRIGKVEQERHEAQQRALRDPLTGLPNRAALEEELVRRQGSGRSYSVLALDLDRFKPINDRHGHDAGDLAIKIVARRVLAQLRAGDMLARVGGDEFVAVLVEPRERRDLVRLAKAIIRSIADPISIVADDARVGISIGIVANGSEHPAGSELKLADRALYEAKRAGGDSLAFAPSPRDERPDIDEIARFQEAV